MTPLEALTKADVPERYWHQPVLPIRPSYEATIYRTPWEIGIRVARKAITYGQILEADAFLLAKLKKAIFQAVRDQIEEAMRRPDAPRSQ